MKEPTSNEIADALKSIELVTRASEGRPVCLPNGKPMIEVTIGPAEVATAPAYPEYVTLLREDWWAMGERATNAEARAARLARDLEEAREQAANDRRLMHAALRKSREAVRPWVIATCLLAAALVWCLVALWRLA